MHEDHEHHCEIENELSASSQLNENFARTINLLEQNRQPHVQRATLHLMCQLDSSERFFPNAQAVREAMDVFDKDTRTCSHNTKHGQTGGKIRYVCLSVCAKGQECKKISGSCHLATSTMVGPPTGKCGMENSCCFKVIFSKERKNHGKQSGGDQFSVSKNSSIFDHSLTCSAHWAPSKQLSKSMVKNSPLVNSMLTFVKTSIPHT